MKESGPGTLSIVGTSLAAHNSDEQGKHSLTGLLPSAFSLQSPPYPTPPIDRSAKRSIPPWFEPCYSKIEQLQMSS